MARRDVEPKRWVPLEGENHVFDQTNGVVDLGEPERERVQGLTDEERSAAAAVISGGFSGRM